MAGFISLVLVGMLLPDAAERGRVEEQIALEIRVFSADTEVTADTRLRVYPAGRRDDPVVVSPAPDGRAIVQVDPGIYDVQAIQERQGRVIAIRWAERLVVMPYPDEAGSHLQVINMRPGYGALQVRSAREGPTARAEDITVFPRGERDRPVTAPVAGADYVLFVLPAGTYDVVLQRDGAPAVWSDVEVPLDRTRLKIARDD